MADTKLAALRVSAEMDAKGFTAGANEIEASTRKAGAAAKGLGDTVNTLNSRLRPASDGLERLKRQFIDGYGAQQNFERALNQIGRALDRGALTAEQAEKALIGLHRQYGLTASSADLAAKGWHGAASAADRANAVIARTPALMRAANDSTAMYRRQNLGMQLFDVGQMAAMGSPLTMIAASQAPQIAQLYAAQGGLNAAMRDFGVILAGVARVAGPAIAAVGALYGGYKILESNSVSAGLAISDATRELASQAAPLGSIKSAIAELDGLQRAYTAALSEGGRASDTATATILANTKAEYDARKQLLSLELELQEAKLATQRADMAIAGQAMRERVTEGVSFDPNRAVREGYADPRIAGGLPFVRLPDDVSGAQKAIDLLNADPANRQMARMRAEAALTTLEVNKMRDALAKPFDMSGDPLANGFWDRYSAAQIAKQNAQRDLYNPAPDISTVPIPQQRPLDGADDEVSVMQKRVDLLRQEVGARRDLAALVERANGLAQSQRDDIDRLRLEAQLVGESAETRARMTAALEAEQRLRQAGIDLLSREGEAYKANAIAMAEARLQIERSQAAYTSYQQAGSSAIDALTASTGTLGDRLKGVADAMLSWVTQMALANPIKNAIYGEAYSLDFEATT